MEARTYAYKIASALESGRSEQYVLLLGLADLECRHVARYPKDWKSRNVPHRMNAAFEKWAAIYRGVHARLGDQAPPPPMFFSGPYLAVLNVLVAEKKKDRDFSTKLMILKQHTTSNSALKCDILCSLMDEHLQVIDRSVSPTEMRRVGLKVDALYTKYIRCLGPFAT